MTTNAYTNTTLVFNKIHTHFFVGSNFVPLVHPQYDKRFGQPGAQIGDTMLIKRQNKFNYSTTQQLAPAAITEVTDALVLDKWHQVSINNADKDLILSVDDKNDQWIIEMTNLMIEKIENEHLTKAMKGIHFYVGTVGVAPTGAANFGSARALLTKTGVSIRERNLLVTPDTVSSVIAGQSTIFNPASEISAEYHDGMLGPVAGFAKPYENALIGSLSTGTRASSAYLCSAFTANSITLSGGVNTQTFKAGEILVVEGCYIMNNAGQQTNLFTAVVASDCAFGADTKVTITVTTPIIVGDSISATPVGANVVNIGAASTAYTWNLAFSPKFYSLGTARLTDPGTAAIWAYQKDYKGVNFRLWMAGDVTNSQFPLRLDALSGGVVHATPNYVPAVRIACAG